MRVRIVQVERVAHRTKALILAPANGGRLPDFAPGSHVTIAVPHLSGKRRAPFSLTRPSTDTSHYQIVVHRNKSSGSVTYWLHDQAVPGDVVDISEPRCGLRLEAQAARHCLVAGGSGITAFFSHLNQLRKEYADYELHYALSSRAEGIYCAALTAQHGQRFKQYVAAEGARLQADKLLSAQTPGTHVYVVGPRRLIQSVVDAARTLRFPLRAIHWDAYVWRPDIGVDEQNGNRFATAKCDGLTRLKQPKSRVRTARAYS